MHKGWVWANPVSQISLSCDDQTVANGLCTPGAYIRRHLCRHLPQFHSSLICDLKQQGLTQPGEIGAGRDDTNGHSPPPPCSFAKLLKVFLASPHVAHDVCSTSTSFVLPPNLYHYHCHYHISITRATATTTTTTERRSCQGCQPQRQQPCLQH